MPKKPKPPVRSENEVRRLVHRYFYDRYKNGRGERGKNGIATTISVIKGELKERCALSQAEVMGAITYLCDAGWVRRDEEDRVFRTPQGTMQPSKKVYFRITADGVDKIDGEGEYTAPKFYGVNITATDRSIVQVGDGNHVDARFADAAKALESFREAVLSAEDLPQEARLSVVADVQAMEIQLVKPSPPRPVLRELWNGVERLVTGTTLAANLATLGVALGPVLA